MQNKGFNLNKLSNYPMTNDMSLNIRISSQLAKVGLQPIMDLVTCLVKKKLRECLRIEIFILHTRPAIAKSECSLLRSIYQVGVERIVTINFYYD